MNSKQPKASGVAFWRRWSVGFEILFYSVFLFQFVIWAGDATNALKGANAVLYYGCALVALIFILVLPLLAYEMACWVVLRPWNKERILQSLQSDQRASDTTKTKPE